MTTTTFLLAIVDLTFDLVLLTFGTGPTLGLDWSIAPDSGVVRRWGSEVRFLESSLHDGVYLQVSDASSGYEVSEYLSSSESSPASKFVIALVLMQLVTL